MLVRQWIRMRASPPVVYRQAYGNVRPRQRDFDDVTESPSGIFELAVWLRITLT